MLESQFFELLKVATGNQEHLTSAPTARQWVELYEMAKKQSLIGITFSAVEKLYLQEGTKLNLPEQLYYSWMASSYKIQDQNESLIQNAKAFQQKVTDFGLHSVVLKGQGLAEKYRVGEDDLSSLRQPGDIDLWIEGGIDKVRGFVSTITPTKAFDYMHVPIHLTPEIEVEIHYRAGCMYNLIANHRFQRWAQRSLAQSSVRSGMGIFVPSMEFNLVYVLQHTYRHMFGGGVGLRQVMDYYFVLKEAQESSISSSSLQECRKMISRLGMIPFAEALCWVIDFVFVGKSDSIPLMTQLLGIESNEKEGRYVLQEIMEGGNFGHHDKKRKSGEWFIKTLLRKNLHLMAHYPKEAFWTPLWILFHGFYKRCVSGFVAK